MIATLAQNRYVRVGLGIYWYIPHCGAPYGVPFVR